MVSGAAFALFLSLILVAVCGVLHGIWFGNFVFFMAFYTAIEGTLLSNRQETGSVFCRC